MNNIKLESINGLAAQLKGIVQTKCNHKNENGELQVDVLNHKTEDVQCRICGTIYSQKIIPSYKIIQALETCFSAIQHLRIDDDILENMDPSDLGILSYALSNMEDQYKQHVVYPAIERIRGPRKKKRKRAVNTGGYGVALDVVMKQRRENKDTE